MKSAPAPTTDSANANANGQRKPNRRSDSRMIERDEPPLQILSFLASEALRHHQDARQLWDEVWERLDSDDADGEDPPWDRITELARSNSACARTRLIRVLRVLCLGDGADKASKDTPLAAVIDGCLVLVNDDDGDDKTEPELIVVEPRHLIVDIEAGKGGRR